MGGSFLCCYSGFVKRCWTIHIFWCLYPFVNLVLLWLYSVVYLLGCICWRYFGRDFNTTAILGGNLNLENCYSCWFMRNNWLTYRDVRRDSYFFPLRQNGLQDSDYISYNTLCNYKKDFISARSFAIVHISKTNVNLFAQFQNEIASSQSIACCTSKTFVAHSKVNLIGHTLISLIKKYFFKQEHQVPVQFSEQALSWTLTVAEGRVLCSLQAAQGWVYGTVGIHGVGRRRRSREYFKSVHLHKGI